MWPQKWRNMWNTKLRSVFIASHFKSYSNYKKSKSPVFICCKTCPEFMQKRQKHAMIIWRPSISKNINVIQFSLGLTLLSSTFMFLTRADKVNHGATFVFIFVFCLYHRFFVFDWAFRKGSVDSKQWPTEGAINQQIKHVETHNHDLIWEMFFNWFN